MIQGLLIALGILLTLLTLPGTLELLALSIAGVLPPRRKPGPLAAGAYRLAVVVPAHNEEAHIARCVKSLLSAGCEATEPHVFVVADNCVDRTASVAADAGATVMVRRNETERGKGYALDFAFRTLLPDGWDAFAVVDADSEVAPDFLVSISSALRAGADAVQCRYLVRNADESIRTRLMSVALSAFNVLRPRGRDRLGISSGIYGNGFALAAETLRAVPYGATSVVEDLEYHLALLRAGRKVRFVDQTAVYGDMPAGGAGVKTQRARWEGGRLRMLGEKLPGMAKEVLRGNLALLEPCLDLLLLPLAFHVALLLAAASIPVWPVRILALIGLGVVALHLIAAIRTTGGGIKDFAALLGAPFYILWKIMLVPRLLKTSKTGSAWVRTERAQERNVP
jgi:cellulose synthase/poly-beta-1,6-N-acetylglucosamine synthase-like glycosyltransferase